MTPAGGDHPSVLRRPRLRPRPVAARQGRRTLQQRQQRLLATG